MKQYPSRLKHKKNHKFKSSFLILKEQKLFYPKTGQFFLKIIKPCKLTFNQIEACRKSMRRNVKKTGEILINVFTFFSQTSKPLASRMGKGKGSHNKWICPVRQGKVIAEISGVSGWLLFKATSSASSRLPVKSKISRLKY